MVIFNYIKSLVNYHNNFTNLSLFFFLNFDISFRCDTPKLNTSECSSSNTGKKKGPTYLQNIPMVTMEYFHGNHILPSNVIQSRFCVRAICVATSMLRQIRVLLNTCLIARSNFGSKVSLCNIGMASCNKNQEIKSFPKSAEDH